MDPLSISAAIAGFVVIIEPFALYLRDVRNGEEGLREAAEGLIHIIDDWKSLRGRLEQIDGQFAVLLTSGSSSAWSTLLAHRRHDKPFVQARAMFAKGGELARFSARLEDLCAKLGLKDNRELKDRSKFEKAKNRIVWKWKKEKLSDDLDGIRILLSHLRNKLSDDDALLNYDTHLLVRDLNEERVVERTRKMLHWICPDLLRDPPFPASSFALNNDTYVDSDITYHQWVEDASWQLNCYGRPGTGKSVRSQAVLADLRKRFSHTDVPVMSLFFHHKMEARQSLETVHRSLLFQLICNSYPVQIPPELDRLWEDAKYDSKRPLAPAKVRELLYDHLSSTPKKYLVIDAVDEAEGCKDSIDNEIWELRHNMEVSIFSTVRRDTRSRYDQVFCFRCVKGPLDFYRQCDTCTGHFGGKLELCQSCYKDKNLRCFDASHPMRPPLRVNIEIQTSSQDFESYVARFLEDECKKGDTGDDDESIFAGNPTMLSILKRKLGLPYFSTLSKKVRDASDSNFLYAHIFLERLKSQRNLEGAMTIIKQLEDGTLEDLAGQFADMLRLCLEADDRDGRRVAYAHLSMVATAYEVLTFAQLSHAAAIRLGDRVSGDFDKRLCGKDIVRSDTNGLLAIETSGSVDTFPVGFFHRSLSVYIGDNRLKWFPDADQSMFEACISYLLLEPFARPFETPSQLSETVKKYPFASYAASHCLMHARDVAPNVGNNLRILELLGDNDRMDCVMQIAFHSRSLPVSCWDVGGGVTAVHHCAFYGLETLAQTLLSSGWACDTGDNTYDQTPLIYACRRGQLQIVEMLLRFDADPNHISTLGKTPLIEAIENGHEHVFDLLLTSGKLQVNVRGDQKSFNTALIRAAQLGQDGMLGKLLARDDIDVNKPDGWNCTALSRAVQAVQPDCVRLLLDHHKTDLTITDNMDGRSALDWTADDHLDYESSPEEINAIAKMLLQDWRKLVPSSKTIAAAIRQSRTGLLDLFVDSLDHAYLDQFERNFLHLAAETCNCTVVKLIHGHLVSKPAFNLDLLDKYKASALHLACAKLSEEAHVDTVRFLLDSGAGTSFQDDKGLTAAQRARKASQVLWDSHVKAIFQARNSVDDSIIIPPTLEYTLRSSELKMFEAVLSSLPDPLDPEADPYHGSTILHLMIEENLRREVLPMLLRRSKHFLSATNADKRTCAHAAVCADLLDALKLFVEAGIDLNVRDRWGLTAYDLAQQSKLYEICVYLITKGAELPPSRNIPPGVLHAAVYYGELSGVKRLVQAGVDFLHRDPVTQLTALQRAEALRDEAAQDANDELLRRAKDNPADRRLLDDINTFKVAKFGTPEVVRREEIVVFLREIQPRTSRNRKQSQEQDVSKLVARLKAMDPMKLLETSDLLSDRQQLVDFLPSYADATQKTISHSDKASSTSRDQQSGTSLQQRLTTVQSQTAASQNMSVNVNVGQGVVIIVVSIVVSLTAITITWLLTRR